MSARELFVAEHRVPDATAALRASSYGSSTSGEQAIWKMGYSDAVKGEDERRKINKRWRPCYVDGHQAGVNAMRLPDAVTDVE